LEKGNRSSLLILFQLGENLPFVVFLTGASGGRENYAYQLFSKGSLDQSVVYLHLITLACQALIEEMIRVYSSL